MPSSRVGLYPGGTSWMAQFSSDQVSVRSGNSIIHPPRRAALPAICASNAALCASCSRAACCSVMSITIPTRRMGVPVASNSVLPRSCIQRTVPSDRRMRYSASSKGSVGEMRACAAS